MGWGLTAVVASYSEFTELRRGLSYHTWEAKRVDPGHVEVGRTSAARVQAACVRVHVRALGVGQAGLVKASSLHVHHREANER